MRIFERAFGVFSRKRSYDVNIPMVVRAGSGSIAIGVSDIHQLGSFATTDINKGDLICALRGDVIDFKEVLRRIKKRKVTPDDPLQIDADLFIDLDPASLAFNHSCNPNAGIRARNDLIAIRDIDAGEEITYDYSTTVSCSVAPDAWTMQCRCNSENCRSSICNVKSVPRALLLKYLHMNVLQSYIVDELSDYLEN